VGIGSDGPSGRRPGVDSPYGGHPGWHADRAWQVLLAAGVAAIAVGVLILAWPGATLLVVGVVFGLYLLAVGVLQLAGAFSPRLPGHLRVVQFVGGALFVLLGLICFRRVAESILLLALWIGFGWLLRGILEAGTALSTPGLPARGWQTVLGIITSLAGIVLIVSPFGSIATLTLVAGILLIALGVIETVHGIQLRADLKAPAAGTASA
jgi:uncharacterized membrane protein HdeD (DUF308 family)